MVGGELGCLLLAFPVVLGPWACLGGLFLMVTAGIPAPAIWAFGLVITAIILAAAAWIGVRLRRRGGELKRDLAAKIIPQAEGQVTYGLFSFDAHVPDRRLSLPLRRDLGLHPGVPYRFYYLPETGFILSAEKLESPDPFPGQADLVHRLSQANGFSLDALNANRAGQLTSAQRLRLLPGFLLGPGIAIIPALLDVVLINALINMPKSGANWTSLLAVAGFAGVCGLIVLFGAWVSLGALADILLGQAASVDGPCQKKTHRPGRGSRNYECRIGGQRFTVPWTAFDALEAGRPYRAYFAPRTKTLLSIEPLPGVVGSPSAEVAQPG